MNGKSKLLGYFDNLESAKEIRAKALADEMAKLVH